MRARPGRVVEPAAGAIEQRAAGERVAVAAEAGAGEADDHVAGLHVAREHPTALDDTHREADEVELAGLHEVGVLGHLAAEQRAPRLHAPVRDAADDVVDDLGDELADRDVVEEEERLRALHRDVVDRHRDEVDADGVVATGEAGDHRLGADAVGRRHEQRVVEALGLEREQAAEAADVTDDLGSERRAHVRLDQLDRLLAGGDVDAGARVGERRRSASVVVAASGVIEAPGGGDGRRPRARASSR